MSSYVKPVVELRVEGDKAAGWRKVVVAEETLLHNLHRIVQYSFMKKAAQDAAVEKLAYAFTFKGSKLGKPKSTKLSDAVADAFWSKKEPLTYVAGGVSYTIAAGKRSIGDTQNFVPRCIAGSVGAALDAVNKKLLTTRFTSSAARNSQTRQLPAVYAPPGVSDAALLKSFLGQMKDPVDADEKWLKTAEKLDKNGAKATPQKPGAKKTVKLDAKAPARKPVTKRRAG